MIFECSEDIRFIIFTMAEEGNAKYKKSSRLNAKKEDKV
jgi:hypothetical protein